ncbi:DNA/RNA nuclease SfsA [Emcibacter nanhaiensis]|uniref:Sugar fermentation stimulation protein homolog n=1 Tax=Emcibacter nanhaiensis TaxID=1505037 RepID=A0A501PAA2_9PROT|nr:DNA/RNA nuclease SfsA [Emcibacter nanhaiensis]TPD57273.1 DNA/RNA nuclease SfsA [Emcibacter nanhaiensis]
MKFTEKLTRGILIKRYKRFLADVELDSGEIVTAHCANSGSMMGLKDPGNEVWLSPAANPKAKLDWKWELVRADDALVGINTSHPNKLVEEAILDGTIEELSGYENLRREMKYGRNSRIDIFLSGHDDRPDCYVEVKNVTLAREPQVAEFPDAVTARGTKHLYELADMVKEGHRAMMVYLVQREDCTIFRVAEDIDPAYAKALAEAKATGVEAVCYSCSLTPTEIKVNRPMEMAGK